MLVNAQNIELLLISHSLPRVTLLVGSEDGLADQLMNERALLKDCCRCQSVRVVKCHSLAVRLVTEPPAAPRLDTEAAFGSKVLPFNTPLRTLLSPKCFSSFVIEVSVAIRRLHAHTTDKLRTLRQFH